MALRTHACPVFELLFYIQYGIALFDADSYLCGRERSHCHLERHQ